MMDNKQSIQSVGTFIIVTILLWGIPLAAVLAGEADKQPEGQSVEQGDFELTIEGDLISLSAEDASLEAVVQEIGRRMSIDVDAYIPAEERITVEFDNLPIEAAIKRLSERFLYLTDTSKGDHRVTKIYLLPKGEERVLSSREDTGSEETIEQDPTIKGEETVLSSKEGIGSKETVEQDPSRPEPFKFEFDPKASLKQEN